MRKRISTLVLLIVFVLMISACSNQDSKPQESLESKDIIIEDEDSDEVDTDEAVAEETGELEGKILSSKSIDIMQSDRYTMKFKTIGNFDGEDMEMVMTTVVADGQIAMIMESPMGKITNIQKEDKMYVVMHDQKMVMVSGIPEGLQDDPGVSSFEIDEMVNEEMEYLGSGKGVFLGNERTYEEYRVEGATMRYYFDGEELDGMEVTSDEVTATIDIEFLGNEVDMSVFEIPEDYMKMGN